MNYVVFALGFKMSSVYISKNCLAVTHYERPFFFPFYWSIKMRWLDANLFWLGIPGAAGHGGTGGTPGRDRRSHLLSESVIPPGRVRPLHAVLLIQPLPAALSLNLLSENLAGRPAWLAAAESALAQWFRQPYSITLACNAPPGFFSWCLPVPQVEFQPWN